MDVGAGSFTFVMATGILSVAAALEGFPVLSRALFVVSGFAYVALVAVLRTRVVRERGFAPFAFVAASGVLGTRVVLTNRLDAAVGLWSLAIAAWLVLVARRPRAGGATMLLVAVGTQALAVLGAALARGEAAAVLLVAALVWWVLGLVLYAAVVWVLARARPRFTPELWVLMGALAIATLAAAQVTMGVRVLHALRALRPVVADAGLASWAAATALIPILAAADVARRARWRYETGRWSFVFPLGMYATASRVLGNAVGWHPLVVVGRSFFAIALAAWTVVAAGLARRACTAARTRRL